MTPSAIALFRPAYARSLNPLSPSPPTSSAKPTFRSDVHDGLPPPAAEVVEPFEHAAAMLNTTSGTATARSHLDMHTLPLFVPWRGTPGPGLGSPGIVGFGPRG